MDNRRAILKVLTLSGAAIWQKPIIQSVVVPAHAQLSFSCSNPVSGSASFSYTGSAQSFTVPPQVTCIQVECWGAQGWSGDYSGGRGGYATAAVSVAAGETVSIYVGQQGQPAAPVGAGPTSFNGGGNGFDWNSPDVDAGGGGGASDVRLGGVSLSDRILVAGGGGGATGNNSDGDCIGGEGGGLTGGSAGCTGNGAASGGTQSSGGTASDNGASGSFGLGGNASDNPSCQITDCGWVGGGGGGWYGGATGNAHQSGAGGSNYVDGQPGYPTSGGATTSGARNGDGQVIITW